MRDKIRFEHVELSVEAKTIGQMKNVSVIVDSLTVTGYLEDPAGNLINPFVLETGGTNYYRDSLTASTNLYTVFDNNNSNIGEFLLKFPELIEIGNSYILKKNKLKPGKSQVISDQDSLEYELNIIAPVIISAHDALYEATDPIGLTQNDRNDISNTVNASVTLEYENYIPLGMVVRVTFVNQYLDSLFSLRNSQGGTVFDIMPASIDQNGNSTVPYRDSIKVQLNSDEVELFAQAQFTVGNLAFRSSGSTGNSNDPFVRVSSKDVIKYRMYGTIIYNVDLE